MDKRFESFMFPDDATIEDVWQRISPDEIHGLRFTIHPPTQWQRQISEGWFMLRFSEMWVPCRVWLEGGVRFSHSTAYVHWEYAMKTDDARQAISGWKRREALIDLQVERDIPDNSEAKKHADIARKTLAAIELERRK